MLIKDRGSTGDTAPAQLSRRPVWYFRVHHGVHSRQLEFALVGQVGTTIGLGSFSIPWWPLIVHDAIHRSASRWPWWPRT